MAQEIPVPVDGFSIRQLTVRPASLWTGPKLLIDGAVVKAEKGRFTVQNDAGEDVEVKFRHLPIDPYPAVEIAGNTIHLVPALAWHEYLCAALPLGLLVGGAIGGGLGAAAAYANIFLFRSELRPIARYAAAIAVTFGAIIIYVVLATLLHGALQR